MNSDDSLDSYIISELVQEKYPLIVDMLKKSENIDSEEKQYWFGALETMDDDQVQNLKGILKDEQEETSESAISEEEITETDGDIAKKQEREQKRTDAKVARKKHELSSRKEDTDRQEELLSLLDDL
jgi:hypothetical protein